MSLTNNSHLKHSSFLLWRRWICGLCFILFFSILHLPPRPAFAGRPFSTEDAGVAGPGVFQLEEGMEFSHQNQDEEFSFTTTPILGLTPWWEVSADFLVSFIQPEEGKNTEGFSDISLVSKLQFLPEKKYTPALLLKNVVKFSNGNADKGLGSGDEDVQLVGVVSKTVRALTLHGNAGYAFVGKDRDESLRDYLIYGLAAEYELFGRVKAVAELYGEKGKHFDADSFHHHRFNPLAGLTFQVSENVVLDIAWKGGWEKNEKSGHALLIGFSLNLFDFKNKGQKPE